MTNDKFQGFSVTSDAEGTVTVYLYRGTRAEMEALAAEHDIDETSDAGYLKSIRLAPREDAVWECELRYEAPDEWSSIVRPSRAWGKRASQLRGSMLSRPLEAHPDYRVCWNHCLCAAPGTTAIPSWYASAANTQISGSAAKKYCWCRSASEAPVDENGRWTALAGPEKPGVDSYDMATYTVIETARFRSAESAGRMVAGVLNHLGSPENDFGISGGDWKCEDAEVSWRDRYWIARLTWTCNTAGWDGDLYG